MNRKIEIGLILFALVLGAAAVLFFSGRQSGSITRDRPRRLPANSSCSRRDHDPQRH